MTPARLLGLYPRAWRDRYGDEFLELLGEESLSLQATIDIVAGAIDARLGGVRPAGQKPAADGAVGTDRGGLMLRMMACESKKLRMSTTDALISAGIILAMAVVGSVAGVWLRRAGLDQAAEFVLYMTFPFSLVVSMPFSFLKGQPWRAQAAIVGGTTMILIGIFGLTKLL
jgi:hypothetical protein